VALIVAIGITEWVISRREEIRASVTKLSPAVGALCVAALDATALYASSPICMSSDAIDDVRTATNHRRLKVHKLKGKLSGCYVCSVNYKIRIVFSYTKEKDILLLAIGDHDIYN
jgi:Txe/YoeB family toxin of Txe-Axe toxin-antitoxin module